MAIHCLGRVLVAIFFVVIMIEPDPAVGLRKSDLLTINGHDPVSVPTTTLVGICESLVIVHGYPCIEYNVKTEDGFVLSMQRIPDGLVKGNGGNNKQPVLLQHGVLMDGMTWLLESPDQSLGFVLADNGYDVWIANSRGTRWSRGHASLDPANPGTLIALAAFSQGKLTDRIKSAALLCPVAYLSHMTTAIGELAARAFVGEITTWLGIAEFNPKGKAVADFLKTLCANPGVDCFDLIRSFTGKNCCLNESTVDLFLKYEPQSTATKNMVHLAQTVRDGIIMKYDYGNGAANIMRYGEIRPPIYNMSNIPHDLPLFLSYGGQDALADTRDVGLLLDALKFHDGDKLTVQFVKDYAHADFVLGVTAKNIVYDAIIAFFRRQ
ncbi:triacylglycerol lipase 2-like isoform X2 [Magnolia sinica]|uniref:triacylglycerol lipase 2-like isoform X2 n=1 Tax=Magnolia sinica TaxID=86752 RepID=UPI002659D4C9|nr:triacylglycerol lipase 2-like isoform X2 [Magnolia sinica]